MSTADRHLLQKQYEQKIAAYKAEKNPLAKTRLREEGIDLRLQLGGKHPKAAKGGCYCYVCGKATDLASRHFPFCGDLCHERWAKFHPYRVGNGTGADTDMQSRIARAKAYGRGER